LHDEATEALMLNAVTAISVPGAFPRSVYRRQIVDVEGDRRSDPPREVELPAHWGVLSKDVRDHLAP
jgi:hypothetical protein